MVYHLDRGSSITFKRNDGKNFAALRTPSGLSTLTGSPAQRDQILALPGLTRMSSEIQAATSASDNGSAVASYLCQPACTCTRGLAWMLRLQSVLPAQPAVIIISPV